VLTFFEFISNLESVGCDGEPKNTEARLRRKLFCNDYDKTVRPVQNHRNKTLVKMKMIVKSFKFVSITLNIKHQWNEIMNLVH
jgi:hypothetical protein